MGQARPIWLRNVALSQNRYSSVMRPSFQRAAVENRMSNEHHHRHVQRILQKRWMAVTPAASAR